MTRRTLVLILPLLLSVSLTAWSQPGDRVPLRVESLTLPGVSLSAAWETLRRSANDPATVFARLKPASVSEPAVRFEARGPQGQPWYRIDGVVSVGPFSMRTFLAGDVGVREAVRCPESPLPGFELTLDFDNSDSWIRENARGVEGLLCAFEDPRGTRVTLRGWMIEGPDFGGIRGPRLKSLLADQIRPLLVALAPRD
jgi:hypothetical protein